jgi:hypothetical protein
MCEDRTGALRGRAIRAHNQLISYLEYESVPSLVGCGLECN